MNAFEGTENALVAKAQAGDEAAFMELVEIYKPRIMGRAARFGRDSEEARDLAQEIFVEIWRGLPGYKQDAPFEHWVSRVATNRCMRFLRKNHRRRASETVGLDGGGPRSVEGFDTAIDESSVKERDAAEAREVLGLALRRLSANDALLITLKEFEGRSIAEIARDTGWSETNVKVRAHRARQKLRDVLERLGER